MVSGSRRVEEEQEFKDFAAQPNVAGAIFQRMAPQIFGHSEIKKALACLLFGGARKVGLFPLNTLKQAQVSEGSYHNHTRAS